MPFQLDVLDHFLELSRYEELAMPPADLVREHLELVRSEKDVPIAVALLSGDVDIFVTNDRDFTDPGATAPGFSERVRAMLPAVFLRDVLGWRPESLEVIRNRTWQGFI